MAIVLDGSNGISAPGLETFGDGTALGGATNPIVSMAKGANNYVQGYIVNNTNGANSSADIVCYPSNGTDSSGWIDMGITGPTFSQAAYGITGPNEGYIFMSALSGSGKTGNLVLATDSTGTQNAIKFATGGFGSTTERMRIDSSGNVGIGTSSPNATLEVNKAVTFVNGDTFGQFVIKAASGATGYLLNFGVDTSAGVSFIQSSNRGSALNDLVLQRYGGNLLLNTTSVVGGVSKFSISYNGSSAWGIGLNDASSVNNSSFMQFQTGGTSRGSITNNNNTGVSYNIVSDRRLKTEIVDFTDSGTYIDAFKPRSFVWHEGISDIGFITDEYQQVLPSAITGEAGAVDEQGNPIYQQGDFATSAKMAIIIAELQSVRKRLTALEAK